MPPGPGSHGPACRPRSSFPLSRSGLRGVRVGSLKKPLSRLQSFSRTDKHRGGPKVRSYSLASCHCANRVISQMGLGWGGAHTWHCLSNSRQDGFGPTSGTPIYPRSRGVHASPLGNTEVRVVGSRSDVLVLLQRRLTVARVKA